jgi:hypothetical protein
MKNLAAVLLLAVVGLPAGACSFKEKTLEERFTSTKNVFRARITEVRLAKLADPSNPKDMAEVVEARFEIKEVFKGAAPASGIVRDLPFGPGNCSLGLLPGLEYVLFPGEYEMVLLPTGSFSYFNAEATEVKPRLDALRKLAHEAAK